MALALSLGVGGLFAAGVYQLLGREVFRMAFGLYLLFTAMNLLVVSVTARPHLQAPLGGLSAPHADPLAQALVLTAVVIGFGLSTFLLMLAARLVRQQESLDGRRARRWRR